MSEKLDPFTEARALALSIVKVRENTVEPRDIHHALFQGGFDEVIRRVTLFQLIDEVYINSNLTMRLKTPEEQAQVLQLKKQEAINRQEQRQRQQEQEEAGETIWFHPQHNY